MWHHHLYVQLGYIFISSELTVEFWKKVCWHENEQTDPHYYLIYGFVPPFFLWMFCYHRRIRLWMIFIGTVMMGVCVTSKTFGSSLVEFLFRNFLCAPFKLRQLERPAETIVRRLGSYWFPHLLEDRAARRD